MKSGKLFVSFWDICLENLPEGGFVRRRLAPPEARRIIEQARKDKRLLCVSEDDLFAPYRERERDNHEKLCALLKKQFRISLGFKDFTSRYESDGDSCYSIIPLNCVQVKGCDCLLVVTCSYMLDKKKPRKTLAFAIAPETVEFHLIESTATARKGRPVRTKAR